MNLFRHKRVLLLLLLMLPLAARAQDLSGIPAAWVDIGLGVRPLGMGGAYTALAEDENATRWNPAALAVQKRFSTGFTYAKQLNLVPYNYLAGSLPLRRMGLGWYVESSGDDVLRENTFALGWGISADKFPFSPTAYNLALGVTGRFRWASFGDNADGGEGQVQGDAWGYGVDLGLYYRTPFSNSLTAGIVLRDLVNTVNWTSTESGTYDESVPRTLALGIAYRMRSRSVFTIDVKPALYSDVHTRVAFGAEHQIMRAIEIRGGLAQDVGTTTPNRDLTLGLGLYLSLPAGAHLRAGVSYLFNELANTPRAGVTFLW